MRPLDLTLQLISPTTYWPKKINKEKRKKEKEKIVMMHMNWDKNEMKYEIVNFKV